MLDVISDAFGFRAIGSSFGFGLELFNDPVDRDDSRRDLCSNQGSRMIVFVKRGGIANGKIPITALVLIIGLYRRL